MVGLCPAFGSSGLVNGTGSRKSAPTCGLLLDTRMYVSPRCVWPRICDPRQERSEIGLRIDADKAEDAGIAAHRSDSNWRIGRYPVDRNQPISQRPVGPAPLPGLSTAGKADDGACTSVSPPASSIKRTSMLTKGPSA